MSPAAAIQSRVKRLIVESLNLDGMTPEMIDEHAPLFGDGLGLDSVDALELVVALER
ncbi:MAG TPA: phosphopantetheine-binding protein, partial [Thermoanaerobaculia bacterium]